MRQRGLLKPTQQRLGTGQELLDGRTNDRQLGLKPTGATGDTMMFQPQKRPNCPADMVALGACFPRRAALNPTELFQPAMVRFDRPNLVCQPLALVHREGQVTCRPVFRVIVYGVNPKHQDKAIALQMHARAGFTDRTISERPVARPIRIDLTVGFQAREPLPAVLPLSMVDNSVQRFLTT